MMKQEVMESIPRSNWYINYTYVNPSRKVFQPGFAAIEAVNEKIKQKMKSNDFEIVIVHSEVKDTNVFQTLPKFVRKIVLATNVAETSITIEDMGRWLI